ncbi:hypothetical protein F4779DRAFT_616277 [Xylariaceae sp. FL0662B]|nr:hypothetical protein F4779DRAFT_616277 [Xylariaceae sp. FL0662B]
MSSTFDFVVVGSGQAGCAVAAGLANSGKIPTVALREVESDNDNRNLCVDGQRWMTFMNKDMNWGYQTVPPKYCDNCILD